MKIFYIPKPFPEHAFEPMGWRDTLSTLDVCTNVHATQHCDEEGYDIRSIYMVSVVQEPTKGKIELNSNKKQERQGKNKLSDNRKDGEVEREDEFYDASEEFPSDELNEVPKPIIHVQIGKERILVRAFLDTGADGNLISNKLYQQLQGIKLEKKPMKLQTFLGETIKPVGVCMLDLYVNELTCGDKFFVTQAGMQDIPLILGRAWQKRHNCFFNWERRLVHCQSGVNKQWLTLQIDQYLEKTTKPKANKSNMQKIKQKQPEKPSKNHHKVDNKACQTAKIVLQKWIPKALLKAQAAKTEIWVPKQKKEYQPKPTNRKLSTPSKHKQKACNSWKSSPPVITYRWVPKADVHQISSTQAWIPEQVVGKSKDKPSTHHKDQATTNANKAKTKTGGQEIKQVWRPIKPTFQLEPQLKTMQVWRPTKPTVPIET